MSLLHKGFRIQDSGFGKYGVVLLTAYCLLLVSCGFEPMYGDAAMQSSRTPLQGNLLIAPIGGRMGQVLKTALEDRFDPEGIKFATPDYRLEATITRTLISTVLKNDGTTQRYDVRFDSNFKLIHISDKKIVLASAVHRTASYNVATNANFATYEAEQDVTERAIREMAEDYMLRLSGYFAGQPENNIDTKPQQPKK